MAEDLAAFGAVAPEADSDDEDQEDDRFPVYPENWQTAQVFRELNLCWRVDSLTGHYLGLDRPSIESTLRLMQIESKRHLEIFEGLRVMEHAALEILNRGK